MCMHMHITGHHQPINVPTAGAQAFLMDYTKGDRTLQSLAPTNQPWACVAGYGPFSLCVIHKVGLCPSSGDINRLMMM
jgi:hypothetical protein